MKNIITISRQYCSGGREIGKLVAERLGISYYDSELIEITAKNSGYSKDFFEEPDRNATNSLLYSIVRGIQIQDRTSTPWSLEETVYDAQAQIINDIAQNESCVIIGRCADYILSEYEELTSIFISASDSFRAERAMRDDGISKNEVKSTLRRRDKRRQNYYNYHADKKWGNAADYDLCLRSSSCGIKGAADIICDFIARKNNGDK